MRIAPVQTFYGNYNKINYQNIPLYKINKAEYDCFVPSFTGSKPTKKQQEKDLKELRCLTVPTYDGGTRNRWSEPFHGHFETVEKTYRKYPTETMELAKLKTGRKEYALDADFIAAAAPYWKEHSDIVKIYLKHYGYNEHQYEAKYLKPFVETYLQNPKAMKKFLRMKDIDGKPRFYVSGVTALASNYKDLKKEIDRFVKLKQDDGTYFALSGERVVDYAKSYQESPVNAERLLQLRNDDGRIVFYENLLKAYDENPEKFEEFLQVTKTNENLERFSNLHYFDNLVPVYAKYPKEVEELAKIKSSGTDDGYRLNSYEIADLLETSGENYNEIIQAINTESWNKPYKCCATALNSIAKALKEHPDVIPQLEIIHKARMDSNFGYVCHHVDSYIQNPEVFSELAIIKDRKGKFIRLGAIKILAPKYINNPEFKALINSGDFSWNIVIAEAINRK
ncbi:MAG: hypothetical protein II085_05600 [Alphaproteobacteria bacterium]|nr:hypothetical protein [Alphaproteobacteria bacterium]